MGKPPMSLLSLSIKIILKIGRKLGYWSTQYEASAHSSAGDELVFPGYPWLLWHVVTARDRYRAYIRARRLATNGSLVICDRFPLPEVKLMDGERTGWLLDMAEISPIARRLAKLERSYYQNILPPDKLFVLRVDPVIAQERRPDEEGEWVKARNQEIWNLEWNAKHYGSTLHVIDANQPQATVLAEIKRQIWATL
ncbi:MAG: hypothetical protein R2932_57645 [Caldilineaceae bacterium]